ncbi:uncharacterized protein [Castor canadensis]|uniref:Uncharacterized protein n=1 Tax=Castor canadensis TaxID=51338 RepID=A0AC58M0Y8_CASCN
MTLLTLRRANANRDTRNKSRALAPAELRESQKGRAKQEQRRQKRRGGRRQSRAPGFDVARLRLAARASARSAQRDHTQPPSPAARPPALRDRRFALSSNSLLSLPRRAPPRKPKDSGQRRDPGAPPPSLGTSAATAARAAAPPAGCPAQAAAPLFISGCLHSVSPSGEPLLRLPPLNSRQSRPPPPLHLAGAARKHRERAQCRWARVDVCADRFSAWQSPSLASDGAWTLLSASGIGAAGQSTLFVGGARKAILESGGGVGRGWGWCLRELQTHTPLPVGPSPPPYLPSSLPLLPILVSPAPLLLFLLFFLSWLCDASLYRVTGLALQWQLMEWGKARQQGWGLRTAGGRAAAAA